MDKKYVLKIDGMKLDEDVLYAEFAIKIFGRKYKKRGNVLENGDIFEKVEYGIKVMEPLSTIRDWDFCKRALLRQFKDKLEYNPFEFEYYFKKLGIE